MPRTLQLISLIKWNYDYVILFQYTHLSGDDKLQRVSSEPAAAGGRVGRGSQAVKSCCPFSNGSTTQTALLADKAPPSCRYQSRALFFTDTYENLTELSSQLTWLKLTISQLCLSHSSDLQRSSDTRLRYFMFQNWNHVIKDSCRAVKNLGTASVICLTSRYYLETLQPFDTIP